jgi:hypothetical protein
MPGITRSLYLVCRFDGGDCGLGLQACKFCKRNKDLGVKHDTQKPRWSLLPGNVIREVIAVLEHGAKKYSTDNWMRIINGEERYYDAAMRHIDARRSGEINDPESKRPHLAHALCCIIFWLWFDLKKRRGHR